MKSFSTSCPPLISLIVLFFSCIDANAQAGMWTWMNGDSTPNSSGFFGTIGVPDPQNEPPGLYETAWWTDHNGNFWMYGGYQYPGNFATALWKYDIANNTWTWMNGSTNIDIAGNYGTMGIPAASNLPGSRCGGIGTWTDTLGNLWMYGGIGYDVYGTVGSLSDVWKYDMITNEWTWMEGNKYTSVSPTYGTYQTFSGNVDPGERGETTCSWIDDEGDFWIYGGTGTMGSNSAMWQYDTDINQWAWMWGGMAFTNTQYGTQGVSSPNNSPGGRMVYAHWKDGQGNFWLYGGLAISTISFSSDVWKYDPSINEWTWMAGSNQPNLATNFGIKCGSSFSNFPASRFENSSSWTDHEGNFWVLGGFEMSSGMSLNDLWCFQPSTKQWIWVSGETIPEYPGIYGIQGVADPDNVPASRSGASAWKDCASNLWLFGGLQSDVGYYKFYNDLWKFVIDPACIPGFGIPTCIQQISINASTVSVCEKFCVDFLDASSNGPTSWEWTFEGGIPETSTQQDPGNVCYNVAGTYDVTLITTNANGVDTLYLPDYITVNATPPFPTIMQNGNLLTSSPAATYQWQFNSVDIPGATNQSYTAAQTGFYTVIIADSNGCQNSSTLYVEFTGIEDLISNMNLMVYPNPSNGNIMVEWLTGQMANEVFVRITNTLGQQVFYFEEAISSTQWKKELNISSLTPGLYFIQIQSGSAFIVKNIIVMN